MPAGTDSLATYRGRFAPTPTGPLHLGSLLTALCSWLDARAADGIWLLRIDDLDGPRCDAQHADTILRQLEAHGLHWDGTPYRQSEHVERYRAAAAQLQAAGASFACRCTRRGLRDTAAEGPLGPVYPGHCRALGLPFDTPGTAQRLRVPAGEVRVDDDWNGPTDYDWQRDLGDFVLWRRDGLPGYALSCAVDEAAMQITHVVRGGDLLHVTPQHQLVMQRLGSPVPRWRHGPLLCGTDGRKLSKQNHAPPIGAAHALKHLLRCCEWLGLRDDDGLSGAATVAALLERAVTLWRNEPRPPAAGLIRSDAAATQAARL